MFFPRKPVLIQIEARVGWLVAKDRRDGHYFGVCPALNLNAIGNNWTEFQECANEAISLLFESLFKAGELEAFLRTQGWHTAAPLPPPGTRAQFEIPFTIEHRERVEEVVGAVA